MNNIQLKNVIMRLYENTNLPYMFPGHITYETATDISQTNLNNTFILLVDNDLYIENRLANDYKYIIGPKPYNTTVIDAAENGYKTWGSENSYELSIIQKKELSIQDSLTKKFNIKSYFAFKYNELYYIGTDSGLLFSNEFESTWRLLKSGKCRNYYYNENSNVVLFAFEDGVYHLRLSRAGNKLLIKITTDTHNIKSIFFRPEDALLVVAEDNALWYAYYLTYLIAFDDFKDNFESVKLQQCDIYNNNLLDIIDDLRVNTFIEIDTGLFIYQNSIFAGTTAGLAQLCAVNDFTLYKTLLSGYDYTTLAQYKNIIIIGTTTGAYIYDIKNNILTPTNLVDDNYNISQIEIINNDVYICSNNKLYKNTYSDNIYVFNECSCLLSTENEIETLQIIENILKVAYIGDIDAYALIVATNTDIYYGFPLNYKNEIYLNKVDYTDNVRRIFDICTIPQKMQLNIAYESNELDNLSIKSITQIQFSKIIYDINNTLSLAKIITNKNLPALIDIDNLQVIKYVKTNIGNNGFIFTKKAIYDINNYEISSNFIDINGVAKDIYDVKYIPNIKSLAVLFDDLSYLSMLNLSALENELVYYRNLITNALSVFGMHGVYDYVEIGTNNYAFLVTKQTHDIINSDCTDGSIINNLNNTKYIIAYATIYSVGISCNKFLRSPAVLDVPTILAGYFNTPPTLHVVNNNRVLIYDNDSNKIRGYFNVKPLQISQAYGFFKIPQSINESAVYHVNSDNTYVYICANIDGHYGLYLNIITGATKIAANSYLANYYNFGTLQSVVEYKQLINEHIYKTAIYTDNNNVKYMYLCAETGLYKILLTTLNNMSVTDTLNSVAEQILTVETYDISIFNNIALVATRNGIYAVTNKYAYTDKHIDNNNILSALSEYLQISISTLNNEIFLLIAPNDTELQEIPSIKYINYTNLDNDNLNKEYGQIDGLNAKIKEINYCYTYNDDTDITIAPNTDFIVALTMDGNIYVINSIDKTAKIIQNNNINNINNIAIVSYTLENLENLSDIDEIIYDKHFILLSKLNGQLLILHLDNYSSVPVIKQISNTTLSEDIIAVGARYGIYQDNGVKTLCIYTYQVSNSKIYYRRFKLTYNNGYSYDDRSVELFNKNLPLSQEILNNAFIKIINNILYIVVNNENSKLLYVINLLDTEINPNDNLLLVNIPAEYQYLLQNCIEIDNIYLNYNSVKILKDNRYYDISINTIFDENNNISYSLNINYINFISETEQFENYDFINLFNNILHYGKFEDSQTNITLTNIFKQYKYITISKLCESSAYKQIIYLPYYLISNNPYSAYALNNDNKLIAFKFNVDDLILEEPIEILANVKLIFVKDGILKIWRHANNIDEIADITYINNINLQFILQKIENLTNLMIIDSILLNILLIYDLFDNYVIINNKTYNILKLIFGTSEFYKKLYFLTNEYIDIAIVQVPRATYIEFINTENIDNNTNICYITNNANIDNGLTIIFRTVNSGIELYRLTDDFKLELLTNEDKDKLSIGGKLANKIILKNNLNIINKIVCESPEWCFIYGKSDNDETFKWFYTYKDILDKTLNIEFLPTGTNWIDAQLDNIKITDIFYNSSNFSYCSTVGLWQNIIHKNFMFENDNYSIYNLNDEDKFNYLTDIQDIKIYYISFYRTYSCIVKAKIDENLYKLFGILFLDINNILQLKINDTPIIGQTINDIYYLVFLLNGADTAEIFFITQEQNEINIDDNIEYEDIYVLNWKHGVRTIKIKDKRNAAEIILNANNIVYANNLLFILGNSTKNIKNSFRFETFRRNKICFKYLDDIKLGTPNIILMKQYNKNRYFISINTLEEDNSLIIFDFSNFTISTIIGPAILENYKQFCCIGKYEYEVDSTTVITTYYFSIGNEIWQAQPPTNSSTWKKILSIDNNDINTIIYSFYVNSPNLLIIATNNGIYYTYSKYTLENNIKKLTPNDVLKLFYDNIDTIDNTYYSTITNHIRNRHANGSVITRINNEIMDTKFSNIADDWIKYDLDAAPGETIIYNDMLFEIKFGEINTTEEKFDYTLYANTFNNVYSENNIHLNYILKRWMSGYTEIYINLPTTGTYYLNHILGTPNCTTNPNEILNRENLTQLSTLTPDERKLNSKPDEQCTHITVGLEAAEYSIDELIEVTIHGNSLPLKIYRDNIEQHYDILSSRLYLSFVLPSVVEAVSTTPSKNGYYQFKFACFGTDALAIKIAFNDTVNRYNANYFTIEFNNNNGAGKLQSQKVEISKTTKLRKNTTIYKTGYAFLGWSIKATVNSTVDMPMFFDGDEISKKILEEKVPGLKVGFRNVITLFAIWQKYELTDNTTYTIFELNCPSSSDVTAAISYEFVKDSVPHEMLVVDYGDD